MITLTIRHSCSGQLCEGRSSASTFRPALLANTVRYRFQTVSRPKLSYTPPSVRTDFFVYALLPSCAAGHGVIGCEPKSISTGDRIGGNADDAAITSARRKVGLRIWPMR